MKIKHDRGLFGPIRQRGRVHLVYGKKGAGKSLLLAKLTSTWPGPVYSLDGDYGTAIGNEYYRYLFPDDSLLVIDEVSLVHRNRDFKSFPAQAGAWHKHVRKMGVTVVMTSQVDDVDKVLRSQADYVLVLDTRIGPFMVGRWYKTSLIVAAKMDDAGCATGAAEIAMGLTQYGNIVSCRYIQYGPRYYNVYDTKRMYAEFETLAIAEKEDVPAVVRQSLKQKICAMVARVKAFLSPKLNKIFIKRQ